MVKEDEEWGGRKGEQWAMTTAGEPLQVTPASGHLLSAPRPKHVERLTGQKGGRSSYQELGNEEIGIKGGLLRVKLWGMRFRKGRDRRTAHPRGSKTGAMDRPGQGPMAASQPLLP